MANFVETLKKPVGPLPLGAWLVVVGVGLGIAYYSWKNRGSSRTETVQVEDVSVDPGVGVGGQQYIYQAPATVVGGTTITNNEEWGKAAISELIAQGYSPTDADGAIRRYLAGNKTDTKDLSLINIALQKLGSPPGLLPPQDPSGPKSIGYFQLEGKGGVWEGYENNTRRWINATEWQSIVEARGGVQPGVSNLEKANAFWQYTILGLTPPAVPEPPKSVPGPVKPAPKPPVKKPTPTPKKVRYVTVTPWPSKHGSLWGIAQSYYGNGALWPRIYNANKKGTRRADGTPGMISNPNIIYDGWKLIVP